jgi:hypothetical protein
MDVTVMQDAPLWSPETTFLVANQGGLWMPSRTGVDDQKDRIIGALTNASIVQHQLNRTKAKCKQLHKAKAHRDW